MLKTILIPIALTIATSRAATVSYSGDQLNINKTFSSVVSSQVVFDSTYLSASIPSFNAALGTLESFSVNWKLTGDYSGTLSTGGAVNSSYGGVFRINDIAITASNNGGNGSGNGANIFFSLPLASSEAQRTYTFTFLASEAGSSYNAAVLTALTGTDPVSFRWDTPLTIGGSWATLNVVGTATSSITYTYSAIPEASTLALGVLGLGSACLRRRRI